MHCHSDHFPLVIGEFNLQVQLLNSFSLPRNGMFYSYEHTANDLAPLGAKPGSGIFAKSGKSDCAPEELRSKETTVGL